jgi:hypothetical protein
MARVEKAKYTIFKQVAEPLWLKEPLLKSGKAREDALDESLFSIGGAVYCKWYKDMNAATCGRGAAFPDAVAAVVTRKMASLHELFYKRVQKGDREDTNNFFKNHRATLVHYAVWCEEHYDGNYGMESVEKAAAFLEAHARSVVERKASSSTSAVGVGDAETMFNAYRNAVAALERLATWQGYTEYAEDLSKHEPVMVLRSRLFGERNVERAAPKDYAASSRIISKRLNPSENQRMIEVYWSGDVYEQGYKTVAKAHRAQMRDLWFHTTQYEIGRRGQDLRAIRYSMFLLHELDCVKPVKPCWALVASLRHAKEVTNNTEIPIAWVRTADREKCPIGASATNFVWQNDIVGIEGSSLLKIMKRDLQDLSKLSKNAAYEPRWRELFYIHSKSAKSEISYSTHRKGVVAAFEAGDIRNKTAKTQIYRTTRACELIEKGVQLADVGLFQGWWHDTAADIYLKGSIKAGPLLQAAGWESMNDYHCWWESEAGDIPESLLALVFPGLDEVAALAEKVNAKTGKDTSAVKVCEVLRWLRKVFIEDAVVHHAKYPAFPAYVGHPLFKHPGWAEFVTAETERVERRRQAWEVQRRDPALADMIKEQLQHKDDAIRELKDMVRELVTTRPAPPPPPSSVTTAVDVDARPVPALFEPKSMRDAYEEWVTVQRANFAYYIDAGIPIPWKELYESKANTMRQRWHKMKPWLTYMDELAAEATTAIAEMARIAAKYRVDEGVFIKDAFYHLVHPPSERTTSRIDPGVLRTEMEAAGLAVPTPKEKREYRKRASGGGGS